MKQFNIFWGVVFFWALYGCSPAGDGHAQAAREVCECMRPLSESYNSIKEALDTGGPAALQQFVEQMEAISGQVSDCAGRIEERYGPLEGERGQQVKTAMQKICPEIIATLNEAERKLMQ